MKKNVLTIITTFCILICTQVKAQSTLAFDQPFFTQNWLENGYTFSFDANDDIRQYTPRNGAGHWFARGNVNAGYLNVTLNDIKVNGIYLYTENASDISNLIIRGYDELGNNIVSSAVLNPMTYQFSYAYVSLNFTRVRKIKIEYTNAGTGAVYADDMDFCGLPTIITGPSNYVICSNGMSADFSISDFSAYNYQWQEDQGGGFTNLSESGIYTGTNTSSLHISSANSLMNTWHYRCIAMGGCSPTDTSTAAELIFTNFVTANLTSSTDVTCSGGNNGSAVVTPGIFVAPPISYVWSYGGSTTNTATGLIALNHTVTVFNGCSNSYSLTVNINEPLPVGATLVTQNDPTCYAYNNGEVSLNISGGTAPYSMNWYISGTLFFSDNNSSHNDLPAGTPQIDITDVNGCTGTYTSFDLNNPPQVGGSITQTNVSCNGGSNGSATVSGNGGDGGPYTYNWLFSGNTTDTETGLAAGTYSCAVSDMTGCSYTVDVTISQPSALSYSLATQTNPLCFGTTGSASVIPLGGTPAYNYLWSPSGETTQNGNLLLAGTNTLTITDMNGCNVQAFITLFEPPAIQPNFSVTDVSCFFGSNGSVTTAASGGTGSYYYAWTPGGATTTSISGLSAGTYTLEIYDDNSCVNFFNATVNEPTGMSATVVSIPVTCNGFANGSLVMQPNGGVAPYTYFWFNSSTNDTITGLAPGTYGCDITDANGCVYTNNSGTITQPTAMVTNATGTDVSCFGGSNGTAINNPIGGTPPYSYLWSPGGQTTQTATGLVAGNYNVTVTDFNGCTGFDISAVGEPAQLLATANLISPEGCAGSGNGSVDVNQTGGIIPYTYLWSSGGTASVETNLTAGTYTCTVTDNNSCIATATVAVTGTNSTDLFGALTFSGGTISNGFAYAFKQQSSLNGIDTVDFVPITGGASASYLFSGLHADSYYIKVVLDAVNHPNAVPTYYGNAFQWDSSIVVNHGCVQTDTADVAIIALLPQGGPGFVSGYVIEGDGFEDLRIFHNGSSPNLPFVPGGPLKGIDVKLGKNPGGGIQARVMTDSTGYYEFTNLPLQGYKIYVDIPNLPMDSTRELVLAAGGEISVQNNYYADSASVYVLDTTLAVGIYSSEKVYDNHFSIYPNPAKDQLNIKFDLSKAGNVNIELTNALGQTVYEEKLKNIASGTYTHQIEVNSLHLKAGVYFISVLNDNKKYTQRLIIIE